MKTRQGCCKWPRNKHSGSLCAKYGHLGPLSPGKELKGSSVYRVLTCSSNKEIVLVFSNSSASLFMVWGQGKLQAAGPFSQTEMTAGSRHDLLEVSSKARRLSLPFVSVILSRHYISTNQGHQNKWIHRWIHKWIWTI